MPIFGKVVQSTPHKRAAHKSCLEDVPKAIFGKITPKQWSKRLSGLPVTLRGGVWQLLYVRTFFIGIDFGAPFEVRPSMKGGAVAASAVGEDLVASA
jgi:hypothetical protein